MAVTNTPMTDSYIEYDKWDQTFYRERNAVTDKWRCNAKARSTQTQCRRWCDKGWDICKFHGKEGAQASITHGKTSKYAVGLLKDQVEEFLNNSDLKDLSHEIALLKAMLASYLEKITSNPDLMNDKSGDTVLRLIEGIRRSVESLVKMQDGIHVRIDITQVERLAMYVITEIKEVIKQKVSPEIADEINVNLQNRIRNAKIMPGLN